MFRLLLCTFSVFVCVAITCDESPQEESTADAFLAIVQEPVNAAACVERLFPDGIPFDQTFFERIDEFRRWIGIGESSDRAIGIVWSQAMRSLDLVGRQQLLQVFVTQDAHAFFENQGSLRWVIKDHPLPAAFLANWFCDLLQAVQGDIMGGAWAAVRIHCEHHPSLALDVLSVLSTESDPRGLQIAGFMLSMLRGLPAANEQDANALRKSEEFFKNHPDPAFRGVFNWSWVATARDNGITPEQVSSLIERAENSDADLSNVVCVMCQLVNVGQLPVELSRRCQAWIGEHVTSTRSPDAKYCVALGAKSVLREGNENSQRECDTSEWVLSIQPVSADEERTWDQIANCLCNLLKHDLDAFSDIFQRLCSISASTLHSLMEDRKLQRLTFDIRNVDISGIVGQLAVSVDKATRRFGLYLFNTLGIEGFPETAFGTNEEFSSRLLFYETQRTFLDPKTIARILAAIAPIAERSTDGFHDEFFDELKLQCHNFSGECRTELESLAKDVPIVAQALEDVAGYFNALERAHKAGVNAMEVTGHRRAAVQQRRLFNRTVSENARSHSPFLSMVKEVQLLYGSEASQFVDCRLHDATPLIHSSTSMEIPIVEFCDPESMAFRRIHASDVIERLTQQHQNEQ